MYIIHRIKYLLVISFLFFANPVHAEKIKIGLVEFPPFSFTDENKKPNGSTVINLQRIFKHAGLEQEIKFYPAKRLYGMLVKGQLDFHFGLKSAELEKYLEYSNPAGNLVLNIYSITPGMELPVKKEEWIGKKMIIVRGYTYAGLADFIKHPDTNIKYFEAKNELAAVKMLAAGRANLMLQYPGPIDIALEKHPLENLQQKEVFNFKSYFIFNKNYPNAKELLKTIENSFAILTKEGKMLEAGEIEE